MTAADAARYLASYEHAIHAIGKASRGRGIYAGPGISVKLSALHPRYARAQHERVMAELLPRLKSLLLLASRYDIGLNIDAEEADRLELSLDLIEAVATDPELAGWDGIGIVVQAYQKRCPFVLDWLIDLARRTGHRFMVRLVKGAYWDSEIKRAQVDGQSGYPVYTRKVHTDVAYLACAKKLLAATDAVYPQFATHNAYTLAAVHELGRGLDWEFQCLHGMGETLYDEVVARGHAGPPLPRLRPGRHPRDPAGLSRPPPARERRQLLLRQPPGRPRGLGRRAGGRPGRHGRAHRRRALRPHPAAARPLRPRAPQLARASTSPASTTCAGSTRACRPAPGPPPPSSPAAPTIPATAPPSATPPTMPTSSARSARPRPTRSQARARRRRCRRPALGRHRGRRARRLPRAHGRPHGRGDARADGAGRPRGRQDPAQRAGRGPRGGRLLPLLRRPHPRRVRPPHPQGPGPRGLHRPLELPARHLHRRGRGRPGRRQPRARQARRADPADRRRRRAPVPPRRRARRRPPAPPRQRRHGGRGPGRRPPRPGRRLHRLDRGGAAHQPQARRARRRHRC